jgi:hypothetical protein
MSVSTIASLGLTGTDWLRSKASSAADAPAPPPAPPAQPQHPSGTANLPQQLSSELQSFLLQLQSAGYNQPNGATKASTGGSAGTRPDGDGTSAAGGSGQPHRHRPPSTQETGSPDRSQLLAGAGGTSSPSAASASSTVDVWSGSSGYPAVLQAYVKNSPPPPMNLQKYA